MSRLLKKLGLVFKIAQQKRPIFCKKDLYFLNEPTHCCRPIFRRQPLNAVPPRHDSLPVSVAMKEYVAAFGNVAVI